MSVLRLYKLKFTFLKMRFKTLAFCSTPCIVYCMGGTTIVQWDSGWDYIYFNEFVDIFELTVLNISPLN